MVNPKTRNSGQWTEAAFTSFVKSALRGARWGPKYDVIKRAKVAHGLYKCELCGAVAPPTLPPPEGKKNRIKNILADHIDPVVDPKVGFVDWNTFIKRLFVETDGFQAICHECHTNKTKEERALAKERRDSEHI